MGKKVNYRKLAFEAYAPVCVHCGFGIHPVLEVAHLDADRSNNEIKNLVILCPNCHKMHDIGLIPTKVILRMRDGRHKLDWKKRMKDAGVKALKARRRNQKKLAEKLSKRARTVWETRRKKPEKNGKRESVSESELSLGQ